MNRGSGPSLPSVVERPRFIMLPDRVLTLCDIAPTQLRNLLCVVEYRARSPHWRTVHVMPQRNQNEPAAQAQSTVESRRAACEVLLVSGSAAVFARIDHALSCVPEAHYRITPVAGLEVAETALREHEFAALLLDLSLIDGDEQHRLTALASAAPATAILALAEHDNETRARAVLGYGAQDYLIAADLESDRLPRMLRSAIERQQHEVDGRDLARRAAITLDSIGDAVLSTDLAGRVTYLNLVAETMTGWSGTEACGQPLATVFNIVNAATRQAAPDPLLRAVQEDRTVELAGDCLLLRKDGHEYLIEDSAAPIRAKNGQVVGAVIVFRDVGGLRASARDLAHLAHHDALTDLPNRLLFGARMATAIVLAHRHARQAALLYLDLDGFKDINDSQGHALGDQLLQSVTRRLVQGVRASDTVCRHGGDEFVILLSEIDDPSDAASSAGNLLRALAEPYVIEGHAFKLTASIGISLYPKDGRDGVTLLRNADSAMYQAKGHGRNQYQFFALALPEEDDRR